MPATRRTHARRSARALPAAPPGTCTIYVRLSREARAENLSLKGMLEDVRVLAACLGKRVVGVHVDDGLSGAIRDRPEFVAWLDDVRECRAETALTFHVDRLTREGVNVAALILDAIEGKDPETGAIIRQPARLADCKGLDSEGDETAFRFSFVIKAEVARAERRRMQDRQLDAKIRLRAAGRWTGGAAPFGFELVRLSKEEGGGVVLRPNEAEAAFLKDAAERALAGATLHTVARWANGPSGMPPRRAKAWTPVVLRQCLTHTPSAVTEDVFDADTRAALRQKLTPDPASKARGRYPSRTMSTLIHCPHCDRVLIVGQAGKQNVTAYRCPAPPGACPRRVSVKAEWVEAAMERRFLRAFGNDPEYVRRAVVSGAAAVEAAHEAENAALAALKVSATPEALAELQAAQAARVAAEAMPQETEVSLVPTGRTMAEVWEATEVDERREILARYYDVILLLPGTHRKTGFDEDRLVTVASSPHALGASDPASYGYGRPTVEE